MKGSVQEQREKDKIQFHRFDARMTPNDPKLSDCGGRRAGCGEVAGGERSEAAGAASVTPGAVRCSAWLGVMFQEVFRTERVRQAGGG